MTQTEPSLPTLSRLLRVNMPSSCELPVNMVRNFPSERAFPPCLGYLQKTLPLDNLKRNLVNGGVSEETIAVSSEIEYLPSDP